MRPNPNARSVSGGLRPPQTVAHVEDSGRKEARVLDEWRLAA
jgi:hypothetical protein